MKVYIYGIQIYGLHLFSQPLYEPNASTCFCLVTNRQGDSMYDLHWDGDATGSTVPFRFAASAAEAETLEQRTATVEELPESMEVQDGEAGGGHFLDIWKVILVGKSAIQYRF